MSLVVVMFPSMYTYAKTFQIIHQTCGLLSIISKNKKWRRGREGGGEEEQKEEGGTRNGVYP